mgnify:FL=1
MIIGLSISANFSAAYYRLSSGASDNDDMRVAY